MMQFGMREEGVRYIDRPGAYGVILDDDGRIGMVKTVAGFYLAGGGIDPDEDPCAALARECREEIGYDIDIIREIGVAGQYVHAPTENRHYNKIGRFYIIRLRGEVSDGAQEHPLVWFIPEEAARNAKHEFLGWAIEKAMSVTP